MKNSKVFRLLFYILIFCFFNLSFRGCGCGYGFSEKTLLPDSVKTVRVQTFMNNAPYQNAQLTPNLSERLRQKIVNQTRLTQTNNDDAHYDIRGSITDYSVTTSGVSSTQGRQQTSINRLTVTVNVTLNNQLSNQTQEFVVSRSFDFDARLSLQQAEANLLDQIVRNLADEIFNRIFSSW